MTERYHPNTESGESVYQKPAGSENAFDPEKYVLSESSNADKIKEIITSLDEEVIKDIFAELFQKSGNNADEMNFLPLSSINVVESINSLNTETGATYDSKHNSIIIHNDDSVPIYTGQILWMIIHEQLHAISQARYQFYSHDDEISIKNKAGYHTESVAITKDGKYSRTSYDKNFNEGVTELITEKIFRLYMLRAGVDTQEKDSLRFTEAAQQDNSFNHYNKFTNKVRFYIGVMSVVADVPLDVIEGAVIRGYIRNGQIVSDDFLSQLDLQKEQAEIFSKFLNNDDGDLEGAPEIIESLEKSGYLLNDEEKLKIINVIVDMQRRSSLLVEFFKARNGEQEPRN